MRKWYTVSFEFGVEDEVEVPANMIDFLRWMADRLDQGGMIDDVYIAEKETP